MKISSSSSDSSSRSSSYIIAVISRWAEIIAFPCVIRSQCGSIRYWRWAFVLTTDRPVCLSAEQYVPYCQGCCTRCAVKQRLNGLCSTAETSGLYDWFFRTSVALRFFFCFRLFYHCFLFGCRVVEQAPHLMNFCHLTSNVASRQQLRSASRLLLVVPRCRLSTTLIFNICMDFRDLLA